MCQGGMNWNGTLTKKLEPRWESCVKDLKNLERIWMPGCFDPGNFGKILRVELHHLLGAGGRSCDRCTSIGLIGEDIGKAGVTPAGVVTMPGLRLAAAVVSAVVSNMQKEVSSWLHI